jgi:DNA methyltransferase 1-associated protein 1
MPTRDTVAQLDSLLEATMALIEMKRIVDKVDYDIQVLKSQLGMKEEQEGDDAQGDTMELDGGMAEGEVGEDSRSQSVVSARSGRGSRRQVNHSFLIL